MSIRIILLMAILLNVAQLRAQLSVVGADTPAFGPEELIREVCLGEGIQVLDIEFNGVPAAVGRFSGGGNLIGLEEGFIMTTGFASVASGGPGAELPGWWEANIPNGSQASHPELPGLANDEIFDVAVYTIRFIPTGDSIMFRYLFASDEYPSFVCTKFNDVFGFFLTGPGQDGNIVTTNIATVPGTNLPVSINSVNGGNPGDHPFVNLSYCQGDNGSLDNVQLFNSNLLNPPVYNGFTDVFVAKSAVTPCQEYTMSLVLADIGDAIFDSGLFFEAKSFCSFAGGGHASEVATVVESCSPGLLEVDLGNFPDDDFPLSYTIAGTAEAGADYTLAGITSSGQIDGPADNWLLELEAEDDGLEEGVETIEISIRGATCSEKTYTIRIVDPFRIEGPASALCASAPITLTVVGDSAALADYPLLWNAGQEGASIQVTPAATTEYVLDYGGYLYSCPLSFTVVVDAPEEELNLELCSNAEGVTVNGTLYDFFNPAGVEVLEGGSAAGCDSIVYINIIPKASSALEQGICQGESLMVNGTLYGEGNLSGLEVVRGGAQDGCDSVVYIDLELWPQQESSLEVVINEGESFTLAGQTFRANGHYELAFPDRNGCDSLVHLRVNVKTQTAIFTDSITVGQTGSLCLDASIFQSVASFSNFCPAPEAGAAFTLRNDDACLDYAGLAPGIDTACLALCDPSGFCDTAYLVVTVLDDLVDDVWPGDVNNDGKVNQVDHWALGLGYGLNGPARPNASNAWLAQPMADWNGTLHFIYTFNRKYADCNGDGQINSGDTYAIYLNFGRTHPLRPATFDFPDMRIAGKLELERQSEGVAELALELGEEGWPLPNAYGLAFEVYFDPGQVAGFQFSALGSWLGAEGQDMMAMEKVFPEQGKAIVSLVRTDHNPQAGFGRVGSIRLSCPGNHCGAVEVRNIQLLQSGGEAFDISEELLWETEGLVSAGTRLEQQVELFPNPARESVWIGLPAAGTAFLFGVDGQLAWNGQLKQGRNEVSVKDFAAGVYVVKIQLPEGVATKKIVVVSPED